MSVLALRWPDIKPPVRKFKPRSLDRAAAMAAGEVLAVQEREQAALADLHGWLRTNAVLDLSAPDVPIRVQGLGYR